MKIPRPSRKSAVRPCEIAVLAGGASSRMGRNKAALRLGRHTLLGHARANARQSGWPHRVIRRDLVPRRGPLGGVHTALSTSNADVVLFLSCDMPFISADLIRTLLRRWDGRHPGLFVLAGGRTGFPFLLRRDTLPVVERLLGEGPSSLHCLAEKLPARLLRLAPRWTNQLFNINTPQDWKVARARWKSRERRSKAQSSKLKGRSNNRRPKRNIER